MKVLIAGGGPGGLMLAYWLHHFGHQPVIIERAAEFRRAGYLISLRGPGLRALEEMNLKAALAARQMDYHTSNIIDERGNVLRRYSIKLLSQQTGGALIVNRADLQEILYDAVKAKVEIRFANTINLIEQDARQVRATFANGQEEVFDLLVGADGYRSQTRTQLFGEGFSKFLGASYCAFSIPNRFNFDTESFDLWTRGYYASVHPYSKDEIGAYFIWKTAAPDELQGKDRRDFLLQQFGHFNPTYHRVLESLREDDVVFHDLLAQIEMPRWSQGRVVLLGDAAYCLTLISGQGASMAMAGGYVLAHELTSENRWQQALLNYESRLRPSITLMQKKAVSATGWTLGQRRPYRWAMRQMVKYTPEKLLLKFFAGLEAEDVQLW